MQLKVMKNDRDPWYADGLSFTCTQCGNCCTGSPGFVWMTDEEIEKLANYLQLTVPQTIERYCRKIGSRYSLKESRSPRGEYDCVFLKEEKSTRAAGDGSEIVYTKRGCTIYPVRPLQCRTWPFWEGNLMSKQAWKSATRKCPGMDTGTKYTREQIEALRDSKEWPDQAPTSKT